MSAARRAAKTDVAPAALLRALAETGDLAGAAARFPGLDAAGAARILREAADALDPEGRAPAPEPAPSAPGTAPGAAKTGPSGVTMPKRVRVFSDGAARGNPGPAGAGAVIQAPNGEVVARLGRYLGRTTNNVAEYQGLLLGLRHALAGGVREVQVAADSELMIKQLRGQYQVKAAHLKPLFAEARALLGRFDRVELVHVPRAENAAADQMANRAVDERLED